MKRVFFAIVASIALMSSPAFAARIHITVDISTQSMTVQVGGKTKYQWSVSTGKDGFPTPRGTFTPIGLRRTYYASNLGNAPMPHSIFFYQWGYAIHGTGATGRLGAPVSHGCIRLAPGNAATLFSLVSNQGRQNTRITIKQ